MKRIIWRNQASGILGLLIALSPFLPIYSQLRTGLCVGCGLLIAVFGFTRRTPVVASANLSSVDQAVTKD